MRKTLPQPASPVITGMDEMNLVEIPFTTITYSVPKSVKTLEFRDNVNYRGKIIERHCVITGSDKYGLPLASDEEVYISLLKNTKDANFNSRQVFFAPRELIKIMGWPLKGQSYRKIEMAIVRLSGVLLYTNSFWDNVNKRFSKKMFHILESGEIVNEKRGRKTKDQAKKTDENPQSYIIWSQEIFESFKAGYLKVLDVDHYFNLRSPISRRIYRLTDKWFYHTCRLELDLFEFAHEKIGLSRNFIYPSKIKEKINPSLEEHLDKDLIIEYRYEKSPIDGNWKLILIAPESRTKRARKKYIRLPIENASSEYHDDSVYETQLARRLIDEVGLNQAAACDIALNKPEEAEYYLKFYHYEVERRKSAGNAEISNPAGWFKKALEEKWTPSTGFLYQEQRRPSLDISETDAESKLTPEEEEAEQAKLRETMHKARLEYNKFIEKAIESAIDALSQEELEAMIKEARRAFFKEKPEAKRWLENDQIKEIQKRLRILMKRKMGDELPEFKYWWEQVRSQKKK